MHLQKVQLEGRLIVSLEFVSSRSHFDVVGVFESFNLELVAERRLQLNDFSPE